MKDFTYKTTAVALQGRRLVIVSRKGGVWTATTTEAGDHYLRHGTYPADTRPSRQHSTASTPGTVAAPGASVLIPGPHQGARGSSLRLRRREC